MPIAVSPVAVRMASRVLRCCRVTDRASSYLTLPKASRLSCFCSAEFNQQTLLAPVGWCIFYTGAKRAPMGFAVSSSAPPTSSTARLNRVGVLGSIPNCRPCFCRVANGGFLGLLMGPKRMAEPKRKDSQDGPEASCESALFVIEQWMPRRDQRFRPPFTNLFSIPGSKCAIKGSTRSHSTSVEEGGAARLSPHRTDPPLTDRYATGH